MKDEKRYWLDDARNVDRIFHALVGVCVLLAVTDFLYHKHVHFFWENWFNFHGFYGLVSCVGLVLLAKQLRKVLMRRNDYYDR